MEAQAKKLQSQHGQNAVVLCKYGRFLCCFGKHAATLAKMGATINIFSRAIFRDYEEEKYMRLCLKSGYKVMEISKIK